MTMSRVRPSSGTGAGTFDVRNDYDFAVSEEPAVRTPLNLDDIPNLDLGAVLRKWEDMLVVGRVVRRHSGSPMASHGAGSSEDVGVAAALARYPAKPLSRTKIDVAAQAIGAAHIESRSDVPVASSDVEDTGSQFRLLVGPVTASRSSSHLLWVLLTGDEIASTAGIPVGYVPDAVATAESDGSTAPVQPDQQSSVDVTADLQRLLDVPAATILRASGISRRTYQHWKSTGATPRLHSQARLWELALAARGWADALGSDLAVWIRRPDRLELLHDGKFNVLTGQVLAGQARLVSDVDWYRDRLAAGYFETVDADLEGADGQPAERSERGDERQPRPGRRARRARPDGGGRRSAT